MVATFIILLNAAIVVVCSMVTFPLIDLAFKKKAKPALWHHDGLTGDDEPAFRAALVGHEIEILAASRGTHSQLVSYPTAQECAVERITPLIAPLLVPSSEGAPPVTAPPTLLTSNRKAA